MRWVWVGGSAAGACAVVALVLYRADLETLSWVAGAGSFVAAVPALVLAILHAPQAQRGQGPGGAAAAAPPGDGTGPVSIALKTPVMRVKERISLGLTGVGIIAAVVLVDLMLTLHEGGDIIRHLTAGLPFWSALGAGTGALFFWIGPRNGRDVLVVDAAAISVLDRRHRPNSLSIPWEAVSQVRVAVKSGTAHVVVTFRDATTAYAATRTHEEWEPERNSRSVVSMSLELGDGERLATLERLRSTLARHGGDSYCAR